MGSGLPQSQDGAESATAFTQMLNAALGHAGDFYEQECNMNSP